MLTTRIIDTKLTTNYAVDLASNIALAAQESYVLIKSIDIAPFVEKICRPLETKIRSNF